MAFRLRSVARSIAAPRALLPVRGGGGGPVALGRPPAEPLAEEDELTWNDGSANPEPCLDDFPLVTTGQAVGSMLSLFGIFGVVGVAVWLQDKPHHQPYVNKQFPYDNLRVERGGRQT